MFRSLTAMSSPLGRWRAIFCLTALFGAIAPTPLRADEPQPPAAATQPQREHPRPSPEERRNYEERMLARHPATPGCFEARYPDEQWVETKCLPPPRRPYPHHRSDRPNAIGAGNDWFATATGGLLSQATGSFDTFSNVIEIVGPQNGDTSSNVPNAYSLQMNANKFTTTVGGCNNDTGCAGWEQFIVSQTQSQCGSSPCVFIEYWLLNFPNPNNVSNPCPTNASWNWYNGSVPNTTPGCYLNTNAKSLPNISVSDLGSVRMNAQIANGNDFVTVSDANGTLGLAINPSIANLGAGWTGVEYGLFGDCCSTNATVFSDSSPVAITVRVATVSGPTNATALNCSQTFSGTTAETNNLNLGNCLQVGGANPAIVFTANGYGPPPTPIDNVLGFIKTANTPNRHVEVHLASGDSGYQIRILETPTTFANESDGVWQLLPNEDLAFIKTSNTPSGHVEVHIASRSSNYQERILETPTTFVNESDGVWQLLPNEDLAFIKTSNTPSGQVEVHVASRGSNYQQRVLETATTFAPESDGVWQLLPNEDLAFIKTSNTPSGHVEVHIASQASNYQQRTLETPTTFVNESDGVWQLLPNADLAFIKTANTPNPPNGHVEVHIASRSSNYQTRIVEDSTTFANETDGAWSIILP